jgi:hypothetical protein
VSEVLPAGWHRVSWEPGAGRAGTAVAGVYLARLEAFGKVLTRKLICLQ